jgi:hypothetical protein
MDSPTDQKSTQQPPRRSRSSAVQIDSALLLKQLTKRVVKPLAAFTNLND